ncbi:unnamed protein product [Arabidopsis halleri]
MALSDVELHDLIAGADKVVSEERKEETGKVYYMYRWSWKAQPDHSHLRQEQALRSFATTIH